jgi:hypothetical protein
LVVENPEPADAPQSEQGQIQPATAQSDTDDIEALWEDDGLGDPLTTTHVHTAPVGKPADFFMACPDRKYRRKTWLYAYKSENVVGVQYFIVDRPMRDKVRRARPCTLLTVVDRAGAPRIWPLWSPRPGENDNIAWITARSAARQALTNWVRLEWVNSTIGYASEVADPGYAPDPDFSRLPPFNQLIKAAFGPDGIWRNEESRAYRACFGKVVKEPDDLVNGGDDDEDQDSGDAEDAVS